MRPRAGQAASGMTSSPLRSSCSVSSPKHFSLLMAPREVSRPVYAMTMAVSMLPSVMRVTKPAPTLPALEPSWVASATSMTATRATSMFMVSVSHCCTMASRYEGRCESSRRALLRVSRCGNQPKARIVDRPESVSRKLVLYYVQHMARRQGLKAGQDHILQRRLRLQIQNAEPLRAR